MSTPAPPPEPAAPPAAQEPPAWQQPLPQYPVAQQAPWDPAWQQAVWQPLPPHPRATLALVLGIVSMIGVVVGVTLVLGPLAWYHGVATMRAIDREPGRWRGRGNAQAGLVMGVISTLLLAGVLLVLLLVVGLTASVNSLDTGY